MLAAPDIALELPLRVLVRERSETLTELVYIDPDRLAADFDVSALASAIAGLRSDRRGCRRELTRGLTL